ncbi:hypothetical protein NGRA_2261 [Nosema granulosis]|uniref:Uncharacterized protein n=1 Tax=Nosema granulosis TaxID=83296 RepID=A0A9P6KYL8_9MICR|nr:hypothetical protein NGRA_2261 [Nosema granulosis]
MTGNNSNKQIYHKSTFIKPDSHFVSLSRYLKNVALELREFREIGKYVTVVIDYYVKWVKKKKKRLKQKKLKKTTKAVSSGEINSQRKEDSKGAVGGNKLSDTQASFEAVLSEVQASQRDWPQKVYSAILSRWTQMPKGGWPRATSFYCEKFHTEPFETMFKKHAKAALKTETGNFTGVREFKREEGNKRIKKLNDIFKIASLKD